MYRHSWFTIIWLLIPVFLLAAGMKRGVVIGEGEKDRPWLGVVVKDLSKKMLDNLNIESGIKILKVSKDSPAAEADLQEDDIIISLDGQVVKDTDDLVDRVREKKIGDTVEIEYLRAGKRSTVQVKLAPGPLNKVVVRTPRSPYRFNMITEDQTWLGIYTVELSEQLRSYFGVPEGQGILIKEVIKDSPADKGGLKAGDIIIKVAQKKVRDLWDIKRAINYFDPGDKIEIKVIREKKEKTLNVTLEEYKQKEGFYFYGDDTCDDHIPLPLELNIDIPKIEINPPDVNIENQQLLEELPQKLELHLKGLNEKLKNLNEKMKDLQIQIISEESSQI
jgi:predicted metalloprotease with PDZ domain